MQQSKQQVIIGRVTNSSPPLCENTIWGGVALTCCNKLHKLIYTFVSQQNLGIIRLQGSVHIS
jgi:hypothetical protein